MMHYDFLTKLLAAVPFIVVFHFADEIIPEKLVRAIVIGLLLAVCFSAGLDSKNVGEKLGEKLKEHIELGTVGNDEDG